MKHLNSDNPLKISMQFFAEGDEEQEPAAEVSRTADIGGETAEPEPQREGTPVQTMEENARWAQFRRDTETAQREAQQEKAKNQRLLQALGGAGYQGSIDDITDALAARRSGIPLQQYRQEKALEGARTKAALENDPEVAQMRRQLAEMESREADRTLLEDLKTVKAMNPKETAQDVFELGDTFLKLRAAGVDVKTAYSATMATKAANTKPTPPEIGALNTSTPKAKDYYTSDEVNRLSEKDLDDPKILEIVMRSMTKWK